MVTKSTLVMAVVAFTLAFIGVSAYMGSLPIVTQKLSEGVAQAKTLFSPLINAFNSIPSELKMILVSGVAGAVSLFMMWTKTRAITKLQQTEQQAATQATQLTSELSQAQTSAVSALQETQSLKDELAIYKAEGGGLTKALDLNRELQAKLSLEIDKNKQLTTEKNILQREYDNKFKEKTTDMLRKTGVID